MNRRQAIRILGATTLSGLSACRARPQLHHYRAVAFGTDVDFQVHGIDLAEFQLLEKECTEALHQMEQLFSLYREDSLLSQLNRDDVLHDPPPLFRNLLTQALELGKQTSGLFDITVQPLWLWRMKWKNASLTKRKQMEGESWKETLDLINYRNVHMNDRHISLNKKGMALTFNGIAQGFATEHIRTLLHQHGVKHTLVNIGEYAALGQSPKGSHWELAIRSRGIEKIPRRQLEGGRALAVSSGSGHTFDPENRYHHLFHPATGRNREASRTVIVTGPSATHADALSTAFAVCSKDEAKALKTQFSHYQFESFS